MSKVLVTGMSGTGKSSALRSLARRGHTTVDTDSDAWSEWVRDVDGRPDWVWREPAMRELLAGRDPGHLFVAGCKTNQGAFYAQFDAVAVLLAPIDVLFERLASRVDNPYGTTLEDREEIRANLEHVEPLLRATATLEVDATADVERVADALEALADRAT